MTAKDVFRMTIETAHSVTAGYLADLSDADLLLRPVPGMNHIAWQLGHMISSEHGMMTALGHAMPELPHGFEAAHKKDMAASDDPKKFWTKEEYLSLWREVHDGTLAAIKTTPDANLEKPGPEKMRAYAPTIGAVFNLIGTHEFMHSGQLVAVRRKLGKPPLF